MRVTAETDDLQKIPRDTKRAYAEAEKATQAATKRAEAEAAKAAAAAKRAHDEFSRLRWDVGEKIGRGLEVAGAGIVASLGASAKVANDFDKSMRNVNSIAQVSEKEFQGLKAAVMGVAKDPSITQGPRDLAKGLYDVYSSGFTGKKALEVLHVAAKGATAGLSDTATSGRALMGVLNSGIPGVHSAKEAMDVLFKVVDRGVINFSELAGSIGSVLPIAAKAGISLQEVGAYIAVATKSGQSGAEAINDLQNLITKIIRPSDEASKMMREMGISYGLTALQSKGLGGVLAEIIEKTRGQQDALGKLFPDMQAFRGLLTAGSENGRRFREELLQMGKATEGIGATQRALNEQLKAAGWEQFKKEIEITAVQAGNVLLPALRSVLKALQELLGWFQRLSPATQENLVKWGLLGGALMLVGGRVAGLIKLVVELRSAWIAARVAAEAAALAQGRAALAGGAAGLPGKLGGIGLGTLGAGLTVSALQYSTASKYPNSPAALSAMYGPTGGAFLPASMRPSTAPAGTAPSGVYRGMNVNFASRLDQLAKAVEARGGRLSITDGFRTTAQQAELYRRKPGLAAPPGRSLHERGMAADLSGSLDLAHQIAPSLGLTFPMLSRAAGRKYEPWHVQMGGGRSAGGVDALLSKMASPGAPIYGYTPERAAREPKLTPAQAQTKAALAEVASLQSRLNTLQEGGSQVASDLAGKYRLVSEALRAKITHLREAVTERLKGQESEKKFREALDVTNASIRETRNNELQGLAKLKAEYPGISETRLKSLLGQREALEKLTKTQEENRRLQETGTSAMERARVELLQMKAATDAERVSLEVFGKTLAELPANLRKTASDLAKMRVEMGLLKARDQFAALSQATGAMGQYSGMLGPLFAESKRAAENERARKAAGTFGIGSAISEGMQWMSAGMGQMMDRAIEQQRRKAEQMRDIWRGVAQDFYGVFQSAFDNLFQRGFKGFFGSVVQGFQQMLQRMAADYLASQLTRLLIGAIGGSAGVNAFFGGGRAAGGPVVSGRSYIVGEQGPELFTPDRGGQIVPTGRLAGAAAGGSVNITFNITTPDVQAFRASQDQLYQDAWRAANRTQARNG
ncbi:MAG: phage tail tape measure protein [Candidatus Eisenbacteria bacterium RBG_16_71_46]|nr:MAG: phage tail tape measure protein [Candidatus Eisenbacteria bacterium RBG_16_71_46]